MATVTIAITRELVVALNTLWKNSAAAGKVIGNTAVRVKALLRDMETALDAAEKEGPDKTGRAGARVTRFNRSACYGQPSGTQSRTRMDKAV